MGNLYSYWSDSQCSRDEDHDLAPLLLPIPRPGVKIIGIAGRAGAGKDTAADYLVRLFGYEKHAFAGPLKRGVSELFGIPLAVLNDRTLKEREDEVWGRTPRHLLQWLGTDVLRKQISNEFFLVSMARSIAESDKNRIVISDVRFDDEARFIRQLGGTIIQIKRPGYENGLSGRSKAHASEQGISSYLVDRVIFNKEGRKDDLRLSIMKIPNVV